MLAAMNALVSEFPFYALIILRIHLHYDSHCTISLLHACMCMHSIKCMLIGAVY